MAQAQAQQDLFGGVEEALPKPYKPKLEHVRNSLTDMVETMGKADQWPWSPSRTKLFRETVWEYLLGLLPDPDEAARWRAKLHQHAVRLDEACASAEN